MRQFMSCNISSKLSVVAYRENRVNGHITTPSDEPQGGKYSISSCGNGCHVLQRWDQTTMFEHEDDVVILEPVSGKPLKVV